MLTFFARYRLLIAAVAASSALAVGYVAVLKADNANLRATQGRLQADLATCLGRSANILEDQASDREIDALDTDALRDLARQWMLDNDPAK